MRHFEEKKRFVKEKDPLKGELAWQDFFKNCTPMGKLFETHTMFESVKNGRGLTLVHVTTSLKEIEQNGYLFASGGGLGASIYAVPLNNDGTLHNLTEFILEYEAPNSLKAQKAKCKNISMLAIHIPQEVFENTNLNNYGFDYLCLGNLQAKIFKQITALNVFSDEDFYKIKNKIMYQTEKTADLLQLSFNYEMDRISTNEFITLFEKNLKFMPFLGYIYFETLAEYILLFQDDELANKYYAQREIYNGHFKRLIFEVSPNLLAGFKLVNFHPRFSDIISYLKEKSNNGQIIKNFSPDNFANFMKWRIAQYLRYKVMGAEKLPANLKFEALLENDSAIIGHLFHKIVRELPSLVQQYFLYEELKAEVIWNIWNKQGIVCPYNSIVPKGEMGINPRFPNLKYKIFLVKVNPRSRKLILEKQTTIKLAPKLINPSIALMSAPYKLPFNI